MKAEDESKYALPYHPTSLIELNGSVILGIAVAIIFRSCSLVS